MSTLAPQTMTLRDGRTLEWREHGPHDGRPVLHHHGGLLSGLYAEGAEADVPRARSPSRVAEPTRHRVVLTEQGRDTADWVDDVRELADHLGLDRFGSFGWSMGGQYAMGTAALLPDRVDRLVVAAGAVPLTDPAALGELNAMDRRLTSLSQRHPRTARAAFGSMGLVARHAPKVTDRSMARGLSDADQAVVAALPPGRLAAAMAEALARPDGMAEEYRAWARPWRFETGTIGCPSHGDARNDRPPDP